MAAAFPTDALDWSRFDLTLEHADQSVLEAISGAVNVLTFGPGSWTLRATAGISATWTGTEQAAAEAIEAWLSSLRGAHFSASIPLPAERYRPLTEDATINSRVTGAETVYTLADASPVEVGMFCRGTANGVSRLYRVTTVAGSTITLAPDAPIAAPAVLTPGTTLTARLAADTPPFAGDPQFLGPWQLDMTEAL